MKNDNAFALLPHISEKLKQRTSPLLVAIDGRCASGKSTLAAHLYEMLPGSTVFHMDDFFLPPEMRTEDRLSSPGGNVHYERFLEEVLYNINKNIPFTYNKYDCHRDAYTSHTINPSSICIIEGAYSMHPKLFDFYDISVFLSISPSLQKARLKQRETPESFKNFIDRWIPLEEKYIAFYEPNKKADFLLEAQS
ncbi:MAG: uridine kinase [Eubacteriales bacterium]|nr:uridine kinase [Eubacteriales bacterium]